ncbi:biotin-dependent carboxyltransferase family protein [Echinicola jeungdonensis]|uniref:Biotin-dependent carboxyltransferase family protein n=1 Tax=Echinicola jeungdonensis TaxID=709343 RepID=A0ABV5J2X9_9BACT|nr:biotin-dependent carboxyltransferase family protein [Echinicola jeungdonensis]MDN3670563.1 biotin-dependent carboxyltransferase family protein [Echinicola jeungdonensis]
MPHIKVIKAGLYSSIQDQGRFGQGQWGVPSAGPMDTLAFNLANHLLRNDPNDACLEMTMTGGQFLFEQPTQIVLTGAFGDILCNDTPYTNNQVINISSGDVLKIKPFRQGCRMYLGIKGGFQTEKILGSRSWYPGITSAHRLKKNIQIPYKVFKEELDSTHAHVAPDNTYFQEEALEVYPGPEAEKMKKDDFEKLFEKSFTLSNRQDRMGIQLEETFPNTLEEILTSPVYPGTIQLTPGGKLLVLMKDAQVTGGYPRVLQLGSKALSILSQKKPGEKIRFEVK